MSKTSEKVLIVICLSGVISGLFGYIIIIAFKFKFHVYIIIPFRFMHGF